MSNLPKLRWFQYRLTTWFIVVAILGCAVAFHPEFRFFDASESVKRPGVISDMVILEYRHFGTDFHLHTCSLWIFGISKLIRPAIAIALLIALGFVLKIRNSRREKAAPRS